MVFRYCVCFSGCVIRCCGIGGSGCGSRCGIGRSSCGCGIGRGSCCGCIGSGCSCCCGGIIDGINLKISYKIVKK